MELIGSKVTAVREMTAEELRVMYWTPAPYQPAMAIEFDDGTVLFAGCDEELNGPGSLNFINGGQIYTISLGGE